jgi:disulfide bond formation protein DsbB
MADATVTPIRSNPIVTAALAVAVGGVATILGAYYFQYVLGYQPCALCLEQRIPFYVAIPFALILAGAVQFRAPRGLLIAGLIVLALVMLSDTVLAAYHAGVEWKWWPGPTDCSGPVNELGGAGGLLDRLKLIRIARCDDASWRFLGLSLAGYDVLITLALGLVAFRGVVIARRG